MSVISRRSLLTGLATAPFLSGVVSAHAKGIMAARSTASRDLYVYLHGAFLLDLRTPCARIFFPQVNGHEYHAGHSPNGEGAVVNPGTLISMYGMDYDRPVRNLDSTTIPFFKSDIVNTIPAYYTVELPLPNDVAPARQVPWDSSSGDFFPGVPELTKLRSLPLLLKLHYVLKATENPSLYGVPNWPDDATSQTLILHLRGENPLMAVGTYDNASQQVGNMMNHPNLAVSSKYACCYACPNPNDPEERSLFELRNPNLTCADVAPPCASRPAASSSVLFTKPANCVGIGNCPTCT